MSRTKTYTLDLTLLRRLMGGHAHVAGLDPEFELQVDLDTTDGTILGMFVQLPWCDSRHEITATMSSLMYAAAEEYVIEEWSDETADAAEELA